ncbi:MAG: collagen-binding protein [Bacteroidetes bacterium GWE2_42_24]|nr:MAG: collagen-binding protein [Bacteroidetes bacterium GWE2_42_24]
MRRLIIFLFFFYLLTDMSAATGIPVAEIEKRFKISGSVTDKSNGELLTGVTILAEEIWAGTTTNVYGFYSLALVPGDYTLRFSYIGYEMTEVKVTLKADQTINVELNPKGLNLSTVEIKADRASEQLKRPEMSTIRMDVKTIRRIPALMGEVDIIKALQLLPGVQSASEGTSGFSVRGGGLDQNLILLDEATVYNASHFMGFFSVFNNDAVKDVQIYKGDIPVSYGGRLASLLDVRMKDGNNKKFSGTGGIGTIASRLTLEGPLGSENTTFIVSGRRTYADIFLPLSSDKNIRNNTLYFYDLNAKVSHKIDDNNRIFISGYMGRDVFENQFAYMDFGNQTITGRWNHLFSKSLFNNLTLIYSAYDYAIGTPEGNANSFIWKSKMKDLTVKSDFTWFLNPDNMLRFGFSSVYHEFDPGRARGLGDESAFKELNMPPAYSLESGIYAGNEQKIGSRLALRYGVRLSAFQNIGPSTVYAFDAGYNLIDSIKYGSGDFYKTYLRLEPRFSATYSLTENSSVKASFSRTAQYIQLAQNSTAGTPLDIWFPVSPNLEPQTSDMLAAGYFHNWNSAGVEFSVEAYYKRMENTIDFCDNAELLFNRYIEGEVRTGRSRAYGVELLFRKNEGRLTGWLGYTFSVARREIETINNNEPYAAPYDKPHNITAVVNYELSPRITLSANWIYTTGAPVTYPTARTIYGNQVIPVYSGRNAYRMPDYHRLDLSVTYRPKPRESRKFNYDINFSLYNAYGRKNAWAINFKQEKERPLVTYAEMTYLFGVVPAVTFNFKF